MQVNNRSPLLAVGEFLGIERALQFEAVLGGRHREVVPLVGGAL
jgi:hypothetical protein